MSERFRKQALAALSAALLMLPAGLQAQEQDQAQDQDNVTIGPPQLRGFQLPGTTTTPAPQEEPSAAPTTTPGSPPAGTTPPAETPASSEPSAPAVPAPAPAPAAGTDGGASSRERTRSERTREPVRDVAPREPATAPPSEVPLTAPEAPQAAPSEPSITSGQAAEPGSGWNWLYLLLAVAIAAAAGLFVARKLGGARVDEEQRATFAEPVPAEPQAEIAPSSALPTPAEPTEPAPAVASRPSGPVVSTLLRPAPPTPASAPQPVPAQPARPAPVPAAPAPAVSAGSGVVGLAIRPWLNLEFIPDRAAATQTEAVVQYELLIKNVGNMVAGNIRVAARMFNAGADQDEQINAFFSQKIGTGPSISKVLAIPPRKGARLRSAVSMSNEEVREISVQGRRLFIPLVAINVLYEWGNGRIGQTAASYLVGREPDAPEGKMGPFRLDLGPRVYRSVGQRPNKVALVV